MKYVLYHAKHPAKHFVKVYEAIIDFNSRARPIGDEKRYRFFPCGQRCGPQRDDVVHFFVKMFGVP